MITKFAQIAAENASKKFNGTMLLITATDEMLCRVFGEEEGAAWAAKNILTLTGKAGATRIYLKDCNTIEEAVELVRRFGPYVIERYFMIGEQLAIYYNTAHCTVAVYINASGAEAAVKSVGKGNCRIVDGPPTLQVVCGEEQ